MIVVFTNTSLYYIHDGLHIITIGDGLYNSKYKKGQFKESKESRRARNKIAKKNKFDPSHQESTLEEKIRFEKEQLEDDSDDESDNMDHIVDTHEEEAETRNDKMEISTQLPSTPSKDITAQDSNPTPPLSANQSRIEQLRSRLHAKLEEKRSQRPVTPGTNDTMVSKRAARRAEKKRRIELAIKKKEMSGSRGGAGSTQTGRSSQPKIVMKDLGGSKINDTTALNSIDNTKNDDLSGIDFGGIAGLKNDLVGNYSEANKSLKNKGKKKSLERLLAEAEAKKDRLRQLKESGDAEDKEKAKKIIWGDTLKIARYVCLIVCECTKFSLEHTIIMIHNSHYFDLK
jgi:DNA excision repair protein ERCC-4